MDISEISVKDIFLDLENPRHDPFQSREEVIDYLCKNEYVYALAQDMVKVGVNPLEIIAVIPNAKIGAGKQTYFIAEGNRRLCAIKLLEDPELAPGEERKNFKAISKRWKALPTLPAVVFKDRDEVSGWLERIHGGLQGGIGRKAWNSEQKTRFTGDQKNLMAQQLLDHAQRKGMINAEERANKISTVQRFISNPIFRDALGVDNSKNDEIQCIRPEADFDLLLKKFVDDLKTGEINTRANAASIKSYSHSLRGVEGVSAATIPPHPLGSADKDNGNNKPGAKPGVASKPRYLASEPDTETALNELKNFKLISIYSSLHRLAASEHCPLLTIGLWSFMDSLTALNGRNANIDFQSYLSPAKLQALGLGGKNETKVIRECLRRLAENGNTTKHDQKAAGFNGVQLINDFEVFHPLIRALVKETLKSQLPKK